MKHRHEFSAADAGASCSSGGCCCGGEKAEASSPGAARLLGGIFAATAAMVAAEEGFGLILPEPWRLLVAAALYLPAAWPVWRQAAGQARSGDLFNEFSLMTLATIGAFLIGQYTEAVAVMVFYRIGEAVQDKALFRARSSIRKALDIRPDTALVERGGGTLRLPASEVGAGEIIAVAPGEFVALDGELLDGAAEFNAAHLTGESRPVLRHPGETVLAGMLNLERAVRVRVAHPYSATLLSRILRLIDEAAERKSRVQTLISRLARIYTPIVVGIAAALAFVPALLTDDYSLAVWGYRALFFLVLSCPCALLISIPLGYYGGIGLAARHGILLKGANFLDALLQIDTVALDKTGTLTQGEFAIAALRPEPGFTGDELLRLAAAVERRSRHPVGRAIAAAAGEVPPAGDLREIPGQGVSGVLDGRTILAGRLSWLIESGVAAPEFSDADAATLVAVAVGGRYAGTIAVADTVKPDAAELIAGLRRRRIDAVLLSGDRKPAAAGLAAELGIGVVHAELLPQDKLARLRELEAAGRQVAAIGDGVNDAPLLAAARVGVAMGALGSDTAVEIADVVIQDDRPSQFLRALQIARLTRLTVWQNIILALAVKAAVLAAGLLGMAELWEAVFADVGVALLAVLNAARLQRRDI